MTFVGELLPYQPEAVDAMCDRGSMLVSYDLGLGKTVLTIAAIERLMDEEKITEPGLVVCLSSIKYQWAAAIERFTGGTSTSMVIDGTPNQRKQQYERARNWETDYVIMNYEQVVNDWKEVRSLPRGFVVVDEATAIKGFRAKRSKAIKKLDAPYRFALTGTPVENGKPEELFSIMQFVDPEVLGRFDVFDDTFIVRGVFGQPERYRNLPLLHRTVSQACVRKSFHDDDVRPFLPETISPDPILVPFDRPGARLYQHIVRDLLTDLEEFQASFGGSFNLLSHYGMASDQGGPVDQLRGRLMSKITCLRMLCDHPQLLKTSAQNFSLMRGTGSAYARELMDLELLERVVKTPKLDALTDYVSDFLDQDPEHKVVVFTSWVDMVAMIIDRIGRYGAVPYTGQMNAREKERSRLAFREPGVRVLVSSDAGGYGVDLPEARLLVNADLPWSSGLATQRNGRIRRASSEWSSIVIQDILMRGSIEERQHRMLMQKNSIAEAVIDGRGINDKGGIDMTVESLRAFLLTTSV